MAAVGAGTMWLRRAFLAAGIARPAQEYEASGLPWFLRWCCRAHVSRLFRDLGLAINATLRNESHATRSVRAGTRPRQRTLAKTALSSNKGIHL